MAGIYIHIPFCRKACHYCDFHFSTNLKNVDHLITAIGNEITLRKDEISEEVKTIYFGGGTPSILSNSQLTHIFEALESNFDISQNAEITLEANPEDIDKTNLRNWMELGVNRLSVGVQSFNDDILKWMNRIHSVEQSVNSIKMAQDSGIDNISIDLIYGVHSRDTSDWEQELHKGLSLNTPHLSSYCLTVEEKTVFHHKQQKGEKISAPDLKVEREFLVLQRISSEYGVHMYEISNYCKEGFHSNHNSNYWRNEPYLGFGPGAHSYTDVTRSWNVSNNNSYIKSLDSNQRPFEKELLTLKDQYHEHILTGLRQKKGISLSLINEQFLVNFQETFSAEIDSFISQKLVVKKGDYLSLTNKGFLLSNQISSAFFLD